MMTDQRHLKTVETLFNLALPTGELPFDTTGRSKSCWPLGTLLALSWLPPYHIGHLLPSWLFGALPTTQHSPSWLLGTPFNHLTPF